MECQKFLRPIPLAAMPFLLILPAAPGGEAVRRTETFSLEFLQVRTEIGDAPLPPYPRLRGPGLYEEEFEREARVRERDGHPREGSVPGEGLPELDRNGLFEVIQSLIAEDSWSNSRNELRVSGGLVATQTPEVLERIRSFLAALEARWAAQVLAEIALVPPGVLDGLQAGWDRPGGSPWLEADAFDRAVAAAGPAASLASARIGAGCRWKVGPRSVSRQLVDHDINQTGVIPVPDYGVANVLEGIFIDALVLPGPGGGSFRVDLRIDRTAAGKPERRRLESGELDLLAARQEHLATSVLIPEGRTAVLGAFRAPAVGAAEGERPGDFAVLLRVERAGAPAPAIPSARSVEEGLPAILDAGALLEPLPDLGLPPSPVVRGIGQEETKHSGEPLLSWDLLEDSLRSALPAGSRDGAAVLRAGGTVFVGAAGAHGSSLRDALEGNFRERARMFQIDLWEGSLDEEALAELGREGVILGDGWIRRIERDPGVRARVLAIAGARVSVASVFARNKICDLDSISGGAEFLILEESDPVVCRKGHGLIATIAAEGIPGEPWIQLRLRGESARPISSDRKALFGAPGQERPEGEKAAGREPPAGTIAVDLPDHDLEAWEQVVTAPAGRPVLLNAVSDRSGPGHTRALIAVVTDAGVENATKR